MTLLTWNFLSYSKTIICKYNLFIIFFYILFSNEIVYVFFNYVFWRIAGYKHHNMLLWAHSYFKLSFNSFDTIYIIYTFFSSLEKFYGVGLNTISVDAAAAAYLILWHHLFHCVQMNFSLLRSYLVVGLIFSEIIKKYYTFTQRLKHLGNNKVVVLMPAQDLTSFWKRRNFIQ